MFSLFEILKTRQKVTLYSFIKQLNIEYLPFISTVPGLEIVFKNRYDQDFLGGPVVRTLSRHCGRQVFYPSLGNKDPTCPEEQSKQTTKQQWCFFRTINPTTEPPDLHRTGETDFWRPQTKPVCTRTQEKGGVTPQETDPDLPVRIQGSSVCPGWPAVGLGALSVAVLARDL